MTPAHPNENDREWLTLQLVELVARVGWERFVLAPLIRGSESFFPDRYVHGPAGVRTVARRMLRHARIGDVRVRVLDLREAESERGDRLLARTEIAFGALEENELELELVALGAAEDSVPTVAHCVARAFRVRRELDLSPDGGPYRRATRKPGDADESLEAQLATVASVYLGFGILAANGAHRYRAAGQQTGGWVRTEWVHDSVGGLDATAVSYLLALQLVVRGVDDAYAAGVVSELGPNQASDVREWMSALRPDAAALRARLGIVREPRDWPAESRPALELLDEDDDDDAGVARPESLRARDAAKLNAGRVVWRVRRSRVVQGGTIGGLVGSALVVAIVSAVELPGGLLAILFLCCVASGIWLGRGKRNDFCSDPRCEAALNARHVECPRCGGRVAGEIARQSERLAAEEELEEREGAEHEPSDADE